MLMAAAVRSTATGIHAPALSCLPHVGWLKYPSMAEWASLQMLCCWASWQAHVSRLHQCANGHGGKWV